MAQWTLYHNPRCSKSRQVKEKLEAQGIAPQVIEYLKTPPSAAQIEKLISQLSTEPHTLARKKEPYWKDNHTDPAGLSPQKLAAVIAANPILLERPLVVKDKKAVVCRPPENVEELF